MRHHESAAPRLGAAAVWARVKAAHSHSRPAVVDFVR